MDQTFDASAFCPDYDRANEQLLAFLNYHVAEKHPDIIRRMIEPIIDLFEIENPTCLMGWTIMKTQAKIHRNNLAALAEVIEPAHAASIKVLKGAIERLDGVRATIPYQEMPEDYMKLTKQFPEDPVTV